MFIEFCEVLVPWLLIDSLYWGTSFKKTQYIEIQMPHEFYTKPLSTQLHSWSLSATAASWPVSGGIFVDSFGESGFRLRSGVGTRSSTTLKATEKDFGFFSPCMCVMENY